MEQLFEIIYEDSRLLVVNKAAGLVCHPIVGDKLYGGDEDLYLALVEDRLTPEQRRRLLLPHHALHAREVRS